MYSTSILNLSITILSSLVAFFDASVCYLNRSLVLMLIPQAWFILNKNA